MNEISQMITQVGFPIFVAVWMLYKSSKDSEELKESVAELKNAIIQLTELLRNGGKNE